ncbi:ABC transporter permease protein [Secundilactobacillus pentosiphilus]|uniref:ABC transporter permease protein n=1 Tax=Secundilactobacillus pentosiphilus TaxID=1714682 RepID=A0A1Z5IT42_9LACO|nr:ABC transporter permease [Secundilactobacillus pentosiphilus]GAX04933.1 ABC transporter permease protein [Secundilactobacillus pentosiphilus]
MTQSNQTAQTGYLTRMYLRHDRFAIIIWLLGIVSMVAAGASKIIGLTGNDKQVASLVAALDTPSMAALFGPFTAVKPYTTAAIFAASMMVFTGLLMAIMNIYFAIRNTRTQEDNGVLEMVRAHSVGRQSPLLATVYELLIINGVTGVLSSATLQAINMDGADITGDWLFGIGLAVFGFMFGTLSLLLSQLASNARGATTMSYSLLGLLYLFRAMTDVRNVKYTWWTIFGWVEKIDPYGKNRVVPILEMLGLAVVVLIVTVVVSSERDLGAGLLPDRPGRGRASSLLAGPVTLVFRLERTSMIAWFVGLAVYGVSMGTLFNTVGDMMTNSPMVAKIIGPAAAASVGRATTLQFAALMSVVMAIGASVPAIATMLRLNSDERKGWLESIHARSVSRRHLFGAYTLVGTVAGVLALFAGTFGMALGSQGAKDPFAISRLMRSFWAFAPAVLVVIGIVAVVLGLLPKLQQVAWVIPIYALLSIYLGGLLDFPEWTKKLTPFGWINKVPLKTVQWDQAGWLVLLSAVLILIGDYLYQRRDLIEN